MRNDVTYLAIMLGLFGLMFGLIRVCDRIIGADEEGSETSADAPDPTGAAGTDAESVAA